MNCTGKRCIMQYDKVDPATCQCVSYCPQATPPKTNNEELVKQLREEGNWLGFTDWLRDLFIKAADAIEELQQTVDHYKGCAAQWQKHKCPKQTAEGRRMMGRAK